VVVKMKESEILYDVPDENDENIGDDLTKKRKEKKKKTKEQKKAERRVVFWTMLLLILISLCFWLVPILQNWKGGYGEKSENIFKREENKGAKRYLEYKL